MKCFLLIVALIIGSTSLASSQTPVITQPKNLASQNYSSTIAVTNTFQSVLLLNNSRYSCTIQNNGSNFMYVYFGAIADATIAKSVKLSVGQGVNCIVGGIVLKDQVSITGTSGEAYYAAQQ